MGTTPNFHLPYPELTDSPDVPRDIKALALALDTPPAPTTGLVQLNWFGNWTPTLTTWSTLLAAAVVLDRGNGFLRPGANDQNIEVLKDCVVDLSAQVVSSQTTDLVVALGTSAEKTNAYAWSGSGGRVVNARRVALWPAGSVLEVHVMAYSAASLVYFDFSALVVQPS